MTLEEKIRDLIRKEFADIKNEMEEVTKNSIKNVIQDKNYCPIWDKTEQEKLKSLIQKEPAISDLVQFRDIIKKAVIAFIALSFLYFIGVKMEIIPDIFTLLGGNVMG